MIRVIIPPTTEPVSLDMVKQQLRVIHDDEDFLIESYIEASRQYCEDAQGRAYIEQTILYTLDRWPSPNRIMLPRAPLLSVISVEYRDHEGNIDTLPAANYTVITNEQPGMIVLNDGESWPTETLFPVSAIRIVFEAGYGATAADVPATVKQAIMMLAAHYMENREAVAGRGHIPQQLPMSTRHLLNMDPFTWTEEFNR